MSQEKVYVGNLSYNTTSDELSEAFGAFGSIVELKLIEDRETGRSKGFAFITFESADDAAKAVESLNGSTLDGRQIKVNVAREDRGGSRGGGGGGRGGNGGRGGRY